MGNFFAKKFKKVYTFFFFRDIIQTMSKYMDHSTASSAPVPVDGTVVAGRNAVLELLKSARPVEKIYLQKGAEGSAKLIFSIAKERKIPLSLVDKAKLQTLCGASFHQGVVALTSQKEYASLDDLFDIAARRKETPFFVMLDGVQDPHNFGAVIRSCEAAGVHGIIVPKNGSAVLSPTVVKSSAGALEHMAICRVSNLSQTVDQLKKRGVWIFACEANGSPYDKADLTGASAVILGSEGFGVSRLLKEKSDFILSLPMRGKVNSLNVSCACTVVLYEVLRQRNA